MLLINIFVFFAVFLSMIQSILSDVYVYNSSNKLITSLNDQSARFGPSFPSDGLKGYITTTNPQNACQQISPPPDIQTSGYRWIALIPRTNDGDSCEFIVKVQNAQHANFSAVIIYNYEDSLLSMGSSTKTVRIPSTLITHTDGLLLISHYLYNKTTVNSTPIYHVKLIPEPPFQFGIYLIVFVVIVAISFLGLIGFLLVKCHLQRRRLNRHRLPRSALKQLKIKKFVKTDPWEVCVICLDDFEEGAKLRILPCAHAYHMKCIDPWLLNNRRQCPVCKRYVFPNLDNSDDEEASNRRRPRPATEQTPLIFSHDLDESTEISVRRQLPQRPLLHPSNSGPRNITVAFNESSDETDESLLSSRPTTTEIMFDRRSSNPRHYGSLHDPSITHRAVNFLAESAGATANTTHSSIRSIIEPFCDSETIDNTDGRMHSVIVASGDNPAYAEDDESTEDTIRTNL